MTDSSEVWKRMKGVWDKLNHGSTQEKKKQLGETKPREPPLIVMVMAVNNKIHKLSCEDIQYCAKVIGWCEKKML